MRERGGSCGTACLFGSKHNKGRWDGDHTKLTPRTERTLPRTEIRIPFCFKASASPSMNLMWTMCIHFSLSTPMPKFMINIQGWIHYNSCATFAQTAVFCSLIMLQLNYIFEWRNWHALQHKKKKKNIPFNICTLVKLSAFFNWSVKREAEQLVIYNFKILT